ncbi:hypothetical protein O6H91_17G080100 [Diphasiastrum complanatum]|uniref:Uncharacterized protein n=1 Tax=Diphasiastrum complanatum TaxID=34168 RepID=A0ACC2B8E9_DIPCM|nr:hypothetical protein O6H91_17G080100 [Diphasiastrum complanatum]
MAKLLIENDEELNWSFSGYSCGGGLLWRIPLTSNHFFCLQRFGDACCWSGDYGFYLLCLYVGPVSSGSMKFWRELASHMYFFVKRSDGKFSSSSLLTDIFSCYSLDVSCEIQNLPEPPSVLVLAKS